MKSKLVAQDASGKTHVLVLDPGEEAFKSIDFTALPNGCQASYPPVSESGDEATCGGPYQRGGGV